MRWRRLLAVGLAPGLLAALPACVHEREKALVRIEDGALAPRGAASAASARAPEGGAAGGGGGESSRRGWGAFGRREAIPRAGQGGAGGRLGDGSDAVPLVPTSAPAPTAFVPAQDAVASAPLVEVERVAAPPAGAVRVEAGPRTGTSSAAPAHRPLPPGASLERIAREKFLASETEIRAEKVTLYVPAAYAAEARWSGAAVVDEGDGRRTAVGGATLVLRRLTIRAQRLTLVAKADPASDVQLSARGDVYLRSDQPASIVEETGLRSLLLRNDGYTPLR